MNKLKGSMNKLVGIRVKELMTNRVVTNTEEDDILTVVNNLISEDIGAVVIVRARQVVGIITEKDLINKVDFTNDLARIKAREVMTSDVKTISPSFTLREAMEFSLKNKIRKLPVVRSNNLVGIVTQKDLLNAFDKFFSQNVFEGAVPRAKDVMVKKVLLVDKGIKLSAALKYLRNSDLDCIIAKNKKEILGIVTERDIIGELYNNSSLLKRLNIEQLGTKNVLTITPGTDIFEANNLMIESKVRRLIVLDGRPVGVVRQTDVLIGIDKFISRILGKGLRLSVKRD